MVTREFRRRTFLKTTTAGTAAVALSGPTILTSIAAESQAKPAIMGGTPVRKEGFSSWPQIADNDRKAWKEVLEDKKWFRYDGKAVETFEKKFAELMGAKECLAVANGTSSLFCSLNALGIGPGDEVLVTPYTFVATINVILLQYALPIFVDTDSDTFQIDAKKIESKITDKTRCILPVHIGGSPADMDSILEIAKKHKLPVVEDACQAHLAEWRGKKVGTLGNTGCFSFQVTKNLPSGEGGAVLCNDEELMDRCHSFHTNGRERNPKYGPGYVHNGTNIRMTEFQGALLLQQMARLVEQTETRTQNAAYLTQELKKIPGIKPAKMYEGTTRNAYHLYMLKYDPEPFGGLSHEKFLEALNKEGIPGWGGYDPLNKHTFLKQTLNSRGYQAIYPKERIDKYFAENECPVNDQLCKQAVWFFQTMFLGKRSDMDQIVEAVRKIHAHAGDIVKV